MNDSRKSLFNISRLNKEMADEILCIEGSLELVADAIESFNLSFEDMGDRFAELKECVETIDEKVQSLSDRFDDDGEFLSPHVELPF